MQYKRSRKRSNRRKTTRRRRMPSSVRSRWANTKHKKKKLAAVLAALAVLGYAGSGHWKGNAQVIPPPPPPLPPPPPSPLDGRSSTFFNDIGSASSSTATIKQSSLGSRDNAFSLEIARAAAAAQKGKGRPIPRNRTKRTIHNESVLGGRDVQPPKRKRRKRKNKQKK